MCVCIHINVQTQTHMILPTSRLGKYLIYITFNTLHLITYLIYFSPTLQTRNLRHKEVKELAHSEQAIEDLRSKQLANLGLEP